MDIWWVEAGDAAEHPAMPRTAPQQRVAQPQMSVMGNKLRNPASQVCALEDRQELHSTQDLSQTQADKRCHRKEAQGH